ncbi:RecQ family ATP-dependent DNA helicase [Sansalvadorimonas verongulae]|uniref:RecQ family ATP-dependent DNA helicase n=1 Tax=Sansalvadorimonas verongulae TaxID=2172824 RepID=UPI0012BBBF76|nr:ATP-dependent DNA helicase RecQ [Sansalvadorimonas verongulae]MTI13962.1 RecQ family ATP-dependent DNA helicase [Sansalvadorimonas verongulae]
MTPSGNQHTSPLQKSLQEWFGFNGFRDGQEQVIQTIIEGRSAAAIFPTGSGKSLCYQLAALQLPHLSLVVSPLLALMQDQLDFLKSRNIRAASIDSTRNSDETRQIMQGVRNGTIKILMVSVERLKNERFRQFISRVPISLLVVDEAHCISEWGHNFRPDYLKLPDYQKEFHIPQALLLTATATPQVMEDMRQKFSIASHDIVATGFYRPNLDLSVLSVDQNNRDQELLNFLVPHRYDATIVYVTQQKTADTLANVLRDNGINAVAYHAGMTSDERDRVQQAFMDNRYKCIVATIAFGMGIDKSDIRAVVHYDLPKSVENYSQEIGRAGRDGLPSRCLVLGSRDNLTVLENFVYGDTPSAESIKQVLHLIRDAGNQWEVQLHPLSTASNIRQLPLKTLLVYLDMHGVIRPQYSYFAEYRLQYVIQPHELAEYFDGERKQFVQALLRHVRMARIWGTLDIDSFCQSYVMGGGQADRSRVIKALDYFQEKNWIVLESKQMTEVYQVVGNHFVLNELTETLHQLFVKKERSEIRRIHDMIALFESEECLTSQLAQWFGDNHAPRHCGHCSACRGVAVAFPPVPLQPVPESVNIAALLEPLQQKLGFTPTVDTCVRFLSGIPEPVFQKIRARSLAGFGVLAAWPYGKVREFVSLK